MQTLPVYDDYIKLNLASIRKSLEKRTNINGLSSEGKKKFSFFFLSSYIYFLDLLSIPPKQFLQILSQVQVNHSFQKFFYQIFVFLGFI
jgi:hypothetical protein